MKPFASARAALSADTPGESPDTLSRSMLAAGLVAAVGAILVAVYALLKGCEARPTDPLIQVCIVVTVVAALVALVGSPAAWLVSRRSGKSTATARLAVALAALDTIGVLGVAALVLRVTLQCAFSGPGSSI